MTRVGLLFRSLLFFPAGRLLFLLLLVLQFFAVLVVFVFFLPAAYAAVGLGFVCASLFVFLLDISQGSREGHHRHQIVLFPEFFVVDDQLVVPEGRRSDFRRNGEMGYQVRVVFKDHEFVLGLDFNERGGEPLVIVLAIVVVLGR